MTSGTTIRRYECLECGKVGLLDVPKAGWHVDGWHISARPMSECMTGPRTADTRCFTEPVERVYVATDALLNGDALEAATREYAGPIYWDSDQPERIGDNNREGYRGACRRCIEAALSVIGGH